jgi:hypothetical protein
MTDAEIMAGYALRSNLEVSLREVVKAMKKHRVQLFGLSVDGVTLSGQVYPLPEKMRVVYEDGGTIQVASGEREPGDGE